VIHLGRERKSEKSVMGKKRKLSVTSKKKSKKNNIKDSVRGVARADGRCVFHAIQDALEPFDVMVTPQDLDIGAATALSKRCAAGGIWELQDVCRPGEAWSFDCVLEALKIKAEEIGRPIRMTRLRDTSVLTAESSKGRFVVTGVINRKVWGDTVTGKLAGKDSQPHDWHHALVVDRDTNTILDSNSHEKIAYTSTSLANHLEEVWRVYQITVAISR
jgi:hypothetical protein